MVRGSSFAVFGGDSLCPPGTGIVRNPIATCSLYRYSYLSCIATYPNPYTEPPNERSGAVLGAVPKKYWRPESRRSEDSRGSANEAVLSAKSFCIRHKWGCEILTKGIPRASKNPLTAQGGNVEAERHRATMPSTSGG